MPISYQWTFATATATNAISGATNASYTVTPIQLANAGTYTVTLVNLHGSITSSNGVLTVKSPPANFPSLVMAVGPEAYWPLTEASGSNAYDYVGGYNGTIIGNITNNQAGPASPTYPGLSATNTAYAFGGSNTLSAYVGTTLAGIKGNAGSFMALSLIHI